VKWSNGTVSDSKLADSNLTGHSLESFANSVSKLLTYCVLRPTQPPALAGRETNSSKTIQDEGLAWLIGEMARQAQSFVSEDNGRPHNVLRYQLAVTSGIAKALLVTSCVISAIANTPLYIYPRQLPPFKLFVTIHPLLVE